jgi:ABC-type branched-subunit amino acid transport system substrate-binding protein
MLIDSTSFTNLLLEGEETGAYVSIRQINSLAYSKKSGGSCPQSAMIWRLCLGIATYWFTALAGACAVEPSNVEPAPFLRYRDTTLEYHGVESDFKNLTEIRIGWFGPHDPTNGVASAPWWAASLAVRDANDLGGYQGLPFRLVPRWAIDPWGTGVSQLTRMVYDVQPLALLGSMDSAATHLAEQVVAKANLPLVSPISTDKSVTLAGVSWMFSCAPTDDAIARVLVVNVLDSPQRGTNKLALLTGIDQESRMIAREVVREFTRHGHPPDFRFEVAAGAHDITRQMAALQESRPGMVMILAGAEDAARLVLAVRQQLPSAMIFGGQSFGLIRFQQLAGIAAEGARFPLLFFPEPTDAAAERFIDRFTNEHQCPPDYTAALTYDATRLLLEAIQRAGPNRARIREELTRLSPWPGMVGPIRFDGTGQNIASRVCVGTIRKGAIILLTKPATLDHALNVITPP